MHSTHTSVQAGTADGHPSPGDYNHQLMQSIWHCPDPEEKAPRKNNQHKTINLSPAKCKVSSNHGSQHMFSTHMYTASLNLVQNCN
jgi:hypothetical protein